MSDTKTRNCSIDLFRYVSAVMVVAIHTNPGSDINGNLGYLLTQILPRIGVPFFFAVAGYFYVQKLEKGKPAFLAYMEKLLFVYVIWSCLYFVIDFIQYPPQDLTGYTRDCIRRFILTGSSEHFWFFPALIFSVCVTTLFFRLGAAKLLLGISLILYAIGCVGCSYYYVGIEIPFLNGLYSHPQFLLIRRILMMGLPFFLCGYLVYRLQERFLVKISTRKIMAWWGAGVVLWLAEIWLVRALRLEINIYITFGLYLLLITTLLVLLKNPLPQYGTWANRCRMLANFTYYSHPAFILILTLVYEHILGVRLTETPKFLWTIGITLVGGLICHKWNRSWLNTIMNY